MVIEGTRLNDKFNWGVPSDEVDIVFAKYSGDMVSVCYVYDNEVRLTNVPSWALDSDKKIFDGGVISGGGGGGQDGLSAYEIWLSLGNTGTEQDFIDSLKPDFDPTAITDLEDWKYNVEFKKMKVLQLSRKIPVDSGTFFKVGAPESGGLLNDDFIPVICGDLSFYNRIKLRSWFTSTTLARVKAVVRVSNDGVTWSGPFEHLTYDVYSKVGSPTNHMKGYEVTYTIETPTYNFNNRYFCVQIYSLSSAYPFVEGDTFHAQLEFYRIEDAPVRP